MSHDLRRDLHDLSQSERPFLDDLPIALLQKRAHRSRVRRTATYSAVGAGAAAAVVFGGIAGAAALRDRDIRPEPPVAPQPTPTETSTPRPTATPMLTPTPTATPTEGAWVPGWEACGEILTGDSFDVVDDDDTSWYVWSDAYPITSVVGEPFTAALILQSDRMPGEIVEARVVDVTAASYDEATYSYEVVGIAAQPVSSSTNGVVVPAGGADSPGLPLEPFEARITSCESSPLAGGDGWLDVPLPDPWYTLMVTVEVTKADGEVVMVRYPAGEIGERDAVEEPEPRGPVTLVPGPEIIAVGTPTRFGWDMTRNTRSLSAAEQAIWCGESAAETGIIQEDPWDAGGMPLSSTSTAFIENGELILRTAVTNNGLTDSGGSLTIAIVHVLRDGRIIAWADTGFVSTPVAEWPTGATVELDMSVGPWTCTFMGGEVWPAGTYEVHSAATFVLPTNPRSDGYPPMYGISRDVFTFTIE